MTATLTLYTNPMSRGRIARWMMEEVGQPYEVVNLDYQDSMKAPEYLAVNPMGKVPALTHGDAIVTETAAICAYLGDAFPDAGLAPPPADPARAPYYRWLFFGAGPLEAASTDNALGLKVPPEREAMAGYGSLARVVDALDGVLSGTEWLAGDRFSAADLYIASHIGWGMQFGWLERRPAFEGYYARASARPAYLRAAELDDAAMPPSPPA